MTDQKFVILADLFSYLYDCAMGIWVNWYDRSLLLGFFDILMGDLELYNGRGGRECPWPFDVQ